MIASSLALALGASVAVSNPNFYMYGSNKDVTAQVNQHLTWTQSGDLLKLNTYKSLAFTFVNTSNNLSFNPNNTNMNMNVGWEAFKVSSNKGIEVQEMTFNFQNVMTNMTGTLDLSQATGVAFKGNLSVDSILAQSENKKYTFTAKFGGDFVGNINFLGTNTTADLTFSNGAKLDGNLIFKKADNVHLVFDGMGGEITGDIDMTNTGYSPVLTIDFNGSSGRIGGMVHTDPKGHNGNRTITINSNSLRIEGGFKAADSGASGTYNTFKGTFALNLAGQGNYIGRIKGTNNSLVLRHSSTMTISERNNTPFDLTFDGGIFFGNVNTTTPSALIVNAPSSTMNVNGDIYGIMSTIPTKIALDVKTLNVTGDFINPTSSTGTTSITLHGGTSSIGGNLDARGGLKPDLTLNSSDINNPANIILKGDKNHIGNLIMNKGDTVLFNGDLNIANSNANGGRFVSLNKGILSINKSAKKVEYKFLALHNLNKGDVVAKTKNTTLTPEIVNDGLATINYTLKEIESNEITSWVVDTLNPILTKAGADSSIQVVNASNSLYLANMNSINKRMGELRDLNNAHGAWGRVFGGEQKNKFVNGNLTFVTVQAGYDYAFGLKEDTDYLGFALSYGYGSGKFNDVFRGVSRNSISYDLTNSTAESHLVEFSVYNSFVQNNGWYNDTVFKLGGLINSMKSGSANFDTSSFTTTLSNEVGYRLKFAENFHFDPQAELTFGYIQGGEFDRFTDFSRVSVAYDDMIVLRTRVGGSFGYHLDRDDVKTSVYVGSFLEHDAYFGGDLGGIKNDMNSDLRAVLNYGINSKITDSVSLYGDVEHSFGGKITTDYKINAGVRYSFGEKTQFLDTKKDETSNKVQDTPVKLKEESKTDKESGESKEKKEGEVKKDEKKEVKKEVKKEEKKEVKKEAKKETKGESKGNKAVANKK